MTYIGASTMAVALRYAREMSEHPEYPEFSLGSAVIVTSAESFHGLSERPEIIYINDDAPHVLSIVTRIQMLEALGALVDWVGGVPTEFADEPLDSPSVA